MKKALDIFQLIVSCATIIGVYYAYRGFADTMELQRETYAIEMYASYFDLYEKNSSLIDTMVTLDEDRWTIEYGVFVERVLFTAESIYNIRGGSPAWDKTLAYMLTPHIKYLEAEEMVGDAFSQEFQTFYTEIRNRQQVLTKHVATSSFQQTVDAP